MKNMATGLIKCLMLILLASVSLNHSAAVNQSTHEYFSPLLSNNESSISSLPYVGNEKKNGDVKDEKNWNLKQPYVSISDVESASLNDEIDVSSQELISVKDFNFKNIEKSGQNIKGEFSREVQNVFRMMKPLSISLSDVAEDKRTYTANASDDQVFGKKKIVDGIFWHRNIEDALNKIISTYDDASLSNWTKSILTKRIVDMQSGCGRMQNRLLTFEDGSRACARYRMNIDQIQGEVYSCHFARWLGIRNVLPCVLSLPDPTIPGSQWLLMREQIVEAQWNPQKIVVLTPWLDNLRPALIPREFRLHPIEKDGVYESPPIHPLARNNDFLRFKTDQELVELAQWSDLIVFDYIIANIDRVVNNLHNLQWNPTMMDSVTHNLEKTANGFLVFVDNESGFFHGYRLLDRYSSYHDDMLAAICIFRSETAQRLRHLCDSNDAGEVLMKSFVDNEGLYKLLPVMPQMSKKIFNFRTHEVCAHLQKCLFDENL